jgi:hypothetical protein
MEWANKTMHFTLNFKYYGYSTQDICHSEKPEAIIILHLQ